MIVIPDEAPVEEEVQQELVELPEQKVEPEVVGDVEIITGETEIPSVPHVVPQAPPFWRGVFGRFRRS